MPVDETNKIEGEIIEPAASGFRCDPALGLDEGKACEIATIFGPITEKGIVIRTSEYPQALVVHLVPPYLICLRAATAEELLAEDEYGDEPDILECEAMEWREMEESEVETDAVALLWTGELSLSRRGLCGPFFARESIAEAWAFSEAMRRVAQGEEVAAQIVCWRCAERFTAELMESGQDAYKRLNRFWTPPLRIAYVNQVALPER